MSESLFTTDGFGIVTIPLDETMNRPGWISVDGDLGRDDEPVVILRFNFGSERGEYLATLDNEIDFGTFRVSIRGEAGVNAGCDLTKPQVEALIAALQYPRRPVTRRLAVSLALASVALLAAGLGVCFMAAKAESA